MTKSPNNSPEPKAKKPSARAKLTAARLAAVQGVYQMVSRAQDAETVLRDLRDRPDASEEIGAELVEPDFEFCAKIVRGVETHKEMLREGISAALNKGRDEAAGASRSEPDTLLKALFLCGGFELFAHEEIDKPIIINDYLNVAHAFYDQGEARLVNAVLDRLAAFYRDKKAE